MATLLNCKVTTFPTGNFRENTCEDPHNLPQIQLASFLIQLASMRLLSPVPISRRWKRQSMPALSYPIPSQISVCRSKRCYVRFWPLADIPYVAFDVEHTVLHRTCPLLTQSGHQGLDRQSPPPDHKLSLKIAEVQGDIHGRSAGRAPLNGDFRR